MKKAMHTGIRCAVAGCANPVIGQCTGYQGSCGRFYCAQHSVGTLCADCAGRKAADERALAIQQDYVETAQRVEREARALALKSPGFIWLVIGSVALLMISPLLGDPSRILGSASIIGLSIAGVWYGVKQRQFTSQLVEQVNRTKPEFSGFYAEWLAAKNKQALVDRLTVVATLVGIVFAFIAKEEQRSADDARLRDAVDDELRRRGL